MFYFVVVIIIKGKVAHSLMSLWYSQKDVTGYSNMSDYILTRKFLQWAKEIRELTYA